MSARSRPDGTVVGVQTIDDVSTGIAGETAELGIDDDRMSREHATIRRDARGWVIVDRESRNGTFVDGDRITGEVRRHGDVVVRLGHTVFVLLDDARGHT